VKIIVRTKAGDNVASAPITEDDMTMAEFAELLQICRNYGDADYNGHLSFTAEGNSKATYFIHTRNVDYIALVDPLYQED